MYAFTTENDVACPQCRRIMVDLDGWAESPDAAGQASLGTRNSSFGSSGSLLEYIAVSMAWEFFVEKYRRAKLRRLARKVLPRFPASLICPNCGLVVRRVTAEYPNKNEPRW